MSIPLVKRSERDTQLIIYILVYHKAEAKLVLLTSADEVPAEAVSEVMEHTVTMLLYSSGGGDGIRFSHELFSGWDNYRSTLS